jgi:hypothetical protein
MKMLLPFEEGSSMSVVGQASACQSERSSDFEAR